ncbi:MAG: hypothetical protein KC503_05500 [Myxococcales bacterium]|nr:hypothetical protein [Myxococcales bacterium]
MSSGGTQGLDFDLIDGDANPSLYAECIRIARALRDSGAKTIGFWPAAANVAVPPLAIQLAMALSQLVRAKVAFIDANVFMPALPVTGGADDASGSIFDIKYIHDHLALVIPKWVGEVGAGVPQLKAMIASNRERFRYMLVDLTGFDEIGDQLNAVDLLDGTVIVGLAGKTRETELLRVQFQLPEDRNLGVVLVGGRSLEAGEP